MKRNFNYVTLTFPALTMVWTAALLALPLGSMAATNDLAGTLQKGLFEEEANHNYPAALSAYEAVLGRYDDQRKLAATALFRLGEIYRKQANTNAAATQFQRLLRDFPDQTELATLSQQMLSGLGTTPGTTVPGNLANAQASETEELSRIRTLIKNSPDLINAPQQGGQTLLQTAAAEGKLGVAAMLIENGATLQGIKSGDLTPLHFAAGNGHKAMVDLLLSKGAKASASTSKGVTPLHLAALKGYETVAKILCEAGAPLNQHLGDGSITRNGTDLNYNLGAEQTALHVAAFAGFPGLISLLISKGAEVNSEAAGRTPLSFAVQKTFESVVEELLKAHADPNAGTVDLPLHMASYQGNAEIVQQLLKAGADPNRAAAVDFPSGGGFGAGQVVTPLSLGVHRGGLATIKLLLQAKANPNEIAFGRRPVLFEALSKADVLGALLDAGANPNTRFDENNTSTSPLENVLSSEKLPQLKLLISHGADVNLGRKSDGQTPLHSVITAIGTLPVAEVLLEAGAKVNAIDKNGRTPLHLAVAYRQKELTDLLLKHKADPNLRDNSGQTPLDSAKEIVRSETSNPQIGGPLFRPPGQGAAGGTSLLEALRKHGAIDDLPRLDRIEIRRPSANQSTLAVGVKTNDWNDFTLAEALGFHYKLLSTQTTGEWRDEKYSPIDSTAASTPGPLYFPVRRSSGEILFSFPDFEHLTIHRPSTNGKSWQAVPVNFQALLSSGDCSLNPPLNWGDVIEIPEADHPISEQWPGIVEKEVASLIHCLSRKVTVIAKGKPAELVLTPLSSFEQNRRRVVQASFMLRSVMDHFKLVRFSSDLTRVKVTRPAQGEAKERIFVLDCSDANKAPAFWLCDGDKIEIPDRPQPGS